MTKLYIKWGRGWKHYQPKEIPLNKILIGMLVVGALALNGLQPMI